MKAWSAKHTEWARRLRLEEAAQEATRLDYFSEVEHLELRIGRLEKPIDEAVQSAPAEIQSLGNRRRHRTNRSRRRTRHG